jgi:hypothetical protein
MVFEGAWLRGVPSKSAFDLLGRLELRRPEPLRMQADQIKRVIPIARYVQACCRKGQM